MRRAPSLTVISSGLVAPGTAYTAWLNRLREARVAAVQLREKSRTDREVAALLDEAVRRLAPTTAVLINGRADLALSFGAQGVHLPSTGLPVGAARRLLGDEALIGRSTHSLVEVSRAADEGADYAYFGPVFETPGKGPAVGLEALERAVRIGIPVIALGGITIERLESVAETGAAGVAGIRFADIGKNLVRLSEASKRRFRR